MNLNNSDFICEGDLVPGAILRHHKGGLYRVIGMAEHSELLTDHLIYEPLKNPGKWWARPLHMFGDTIMSKGKYCSRFMKYSFFDDLSHNYPVISPFQEEGRLGIGLKMPKGTEVRNQGIDGRVVYADYSPTAGHWIHIEQEIDGEVYLFVYMHLSELYVEEDDHVKSGQVIGLSGNSGNSTGPHLSFEIWKGPRGTRLEAGSVAINPLKALEKLKFGT